MERWYEFGGAHQGDEAEWQSTPYFPSASQAVNALFHYTTEPDDAYRRYDTPSPPLALTQGVHDHDELDFGLDQEMGQPDFFGDVFADSSEPWLEAHMAPSAPATSAAYADAATKRQMREYYNQQRLFRQKQVRTSKRRATGSAPTTRSRTSSVAPLQAASPLTNLVAAASEAATTERERLPHQTDEWLENRAAALERHKRKMAPIRAGGYNNALELARRPAGNRPRRRGKFAKTSSAATAATATKKTTNR